MNAATSSLAYSETQPLETPLGCAVNHDVTKKSQDLTGTQTLLESVWNRNTNTSLQSVLAIVFHASVSIGFLPA
jgi:hypothetical protein